MLEARNRKVRSLAYVLVGLAIFVVTAHVISVLFAHFSPESWIAEVAPKFDLDNERNVPTAYSGIVFGCCALISLLLVSPTRKLVERLRWALFSLFFFYLAFDELLSIHETFAEPIRKSLSILDGSIFYHAWVIPASIIAIGIGFLMLSIRSSDPMSKLQKRILIYVLVLAVGDIVLEMVGTQVYFTTLVYKLGPVLLEEVFELGMASLILCTLTTGLLKKA